MTRPSPERDQPAIATRPLQEVWSIAWPTVLTMTSYTAMQFVDSLMVGQVSPLAVAAQGNGGIWAFAPLGVAMGLLTVVNTFVSQNLGAGRPENGPRYAWAAIWLSVVTWSVILLPFAYVLRWIFPLLHDAQAVEHVHELVRLEVGYARILLAGGVVMLMARSMHHYFFGLHRPKIITLSALVGNGTNIIANYVLIFGEQGLPKLGLPGIPGVPAMGVYGAALGTVIGTCVELAIPMAVFLGPRMHAELASRSAWRPSLVAIRDLLRIGWPAGMQFGNEIICWAIFMTVLVGRFGEEHMTAGWIALRYMHLSFMPAIGFSVAVTSLVGRYIGAGQPDTAVARARLGLKMAVAYMTLCGLTFFVFRDHLVAAFVGGDVGAEQAQRIVEIGAKLLICAAVFQTVDAFGIVYSGALRGAGDTVWPGLITMLYSWTLIIGGGLAAVILLPGLESIGPWLAATAYITAFGVTMAWRFESGRWRSIRLLHDQRRGAAQVAPVVAAPPAAEAEGSVRDLAEELAEKEGERRPRDEPPIAALEPTGSAE